MRLPRGLSAEEAALWAQLASTVTPLHPRSAKTATKSAEIKFHPAPKLPKAAPCGRAAPQLAPAPAPRPTSSAGLDSHWERRLKTSANPEFTLDLHGHTLDSAHKRLDQGLIQAKAMGARLVLVITGKPRPVEAADRGERRGAIRAKVLDWLAAGPHSADIAAVRKARASHGGEGALYLVLKRRK